MANMVQMMQKAQKFKAGLQELQARVRGIEVTGAAGGGLVTCRMTGGFVTKHVRIDTSVISAAEKETLEDLVAAAVNDARQKAEALMKEETAKLMQALGLPPEFAGELPF